MQLNTLFQPTLQNSNEMDIFTRNKFLLRIIFILIFINLFSTGYLWWNKKGEPNDRQPRREKENSTQILKDKLQCSLRMLQNHTPIIPLPYIEGR